MKIVVIGGSGLIGSKLINLLHQKGYDDVVSASLATGVNTITGEGLAEALAGAEVVVDVTNSPSFEDKAVLEFFETSGRNIIAAEGKAGVKHHVALSIVGTDRVPDSGYLRAKVAQEKLIRESPIPYTILRSTQFFEFLRGIAESGTIDQTIHLTPALFQPIATDDVVAALADVVVGAPVNDILEVAGPERISLAQLVKRFLSKTGDTRTVVPDVNARYFGAVLNDQSLTPGPNARIGAQSFEEWFSKSMIKM
jgi:uncharacterized protein YbjT (DUF2867 family)